MNYEQIAETLTINVFYLKNKMQLYWLYGHSLVILVNNSLKLDGVQPQCFVLKFQTGYIFTQNVGLEAISRPVRHLYRLHCSGRPTYGRSITTQSAWRGTWAGRGAVGAFKISLWTKTSNNSLVFFLNYPIYFFSFNPKLILEKKSGRLCEEHFIPPHSGSGMKSLPTALASAE